MAGGSCTETNHTPGPWRLSEHEDGCIVQRGDEGGFFVQGLSKDRVRADARLIAAAPELLRVLEMAERYLFERGIDYRGTQGRTVVLPSMRAAIKLARGE